MTTAEVHGVKFDRTLSFAKHARNVKVKLAARNSLLGKLTKTWGADPKTFWTIAQALM